MIAASIFLSVAMTLQPESGLRLVNPHPIAVDAKVTCADGARELRLDPHAVVDLAVGSPCTTPTLETTLPLIALETRGEAEQRLVTEETCAPVTMSAPLFACEKGVANASVPLLDGATYAWTAEGGTIAGSASANRVSVNLGESASAKLVCVVTHGGCSTNATGIIAIRKPLLIHELNVPQQADTAQPLTISWNYTGDAAPAAQLLTGDAFPQPVTLSGGQRSYTYTPTTSGTRNVELTASYATSIQPPAAPSGRRRASGRTFATATQCPSVRATKQIELRGCALETPEINAPADVESGSTFIASVDVLPGDAVEWDVDGGGVLLTASSLPQIQVRTDDFGAAVDLSVRVFRSADCESRSGHQVTIHPRAACTTNPPTVALSVLSRDCYKAMIQAVFTGVPPFTGRWFDGTEFTTSATVISHEVYVPGVYEGKGPIGIGNFRDSICNGLNAGVSVEDIRPDATVSVVGGNCPNSKMVATLIGTPPFSGKWSDGEAFTTSNFTVEKTNPMSSHTEEVYIRSLEDATCGAGPKSDNRVRLDPPPSLQISSLEPFCQFDTGQVSIGLQMIGGVPPYSVEWSDGVVTTGNSQYFSRTFTEKVSTQIEIVRATTATCDATFWNPIATILYRPEPRIDEASTTVTCFGQSGHASLKEEIPGATLEWTITNGTILTGQGTSSVTFQGLARAPMMLKVTASYPDGFCSRWATHSVFVDEVTGDIQNLKAEPATITAGGTSIISYKVFGGVRWLQMDVDPKSRYTDLKSDQWDCTPADVCSVVYHDSKGPGMATVGVFYGGDCIADGARFVDITITP